MSQNFAILFQMTVYDPSLLLFHRRHRTDAATVFKRVVMQHRPYWTGRPQQYRDTTVTIAVILWRRSYWITERRGLY